MAGSFFALALAAVGAGTLNAGSLPPETTILAPPREGFPLPGCSRPTAGPIEGGWEPKDIDILDMEAALALAMQSLANLPIYEKGTESPDPLTYQAGDPRWQRQFFGIVRGGRFLVYGNYLPAHVDIDPAHMPTGVCDGGPVFFGAEYDIETGAITHLAFNGGLGGPFWPAFAP